MSREPTSLPISCTQETMGCSLRPQGRSSIHPRDNTQILAPPHTQCSSRHPLESRHVDSIEKRAFSFSQTIPHPPEGVKGTGDTNTKGPKDPMSTLELLSFFRVTADPQLRRSRRQLPAAVLGLYLHGASCLGHSAFLQFPGPSDPQPDHPGWDDGRKGRQLRPTEG